MRKILESRHDRYIFDNTVYDIPCLKGKAVGADLRFRTNVFASEDMDMVVFEHNNKDGTKKEIELSFKELDIDFELFLISMRFIDKGYVTEIIDTVGDVSKFMYKTNW